MIICQANTELQSHYYYPTLSGKILWLYVFKRIKSNRFIIVFICFVTLTLQEIVTNIGQTKKMNGIFINCVYSDLKEMRTGKIISAEEIKKALYNAGLVIEGYFGDKEPGIYLSYRDCVEVADKVKKFKEKNPELSDKCKLVFLEYNGKVSDVHLLTA